MAVSNADILGWLNANPDADDSLINQVMAQAGVSSQQFAEATGMNMDDAAMRYSQADMAMNAQAEQQARAEQEAAARWEAENVARWQAQQAQQWEAQQQAIRDQQDAERLFNERIIAPKITVEDLYRQYAGREGDPGGLEFWKQGFGDTIDANEIASFQNAVAQTQQQEQQRQVEEQAQRAQEAAQREIQLQEERDARDTVNRNNVVAGPVTPQVTDADILGWMNANPNASIEVLADTMRQAGVSSERLGQVTGKTLEDRVAATQPVAGPVAPPTNTQQQQQQQQSQAVAGPVTPTSNGQTSSALSNEQVDKMVRDAYAGIGRTGVGAGVSQIDQAGYDAFANALKTGAVAPQDFSAKFQDAVKQYMIDNPTDVYSKYVGNYLVTNKKEDYVAGPTTAQVVAAIDKWSLDNPNATTEQLAKAIDTGMGMTDTVKLALAQKYNIPTTDVVTVFNKALDPYAGVQITDADGKSYDAKQLMNLASQIAGNIDTSKSGGGAFSTKGESIGFDYNTLSSTFGGKEFSILKNQLILT